MAVPDERFFTAVLAELPADRLSRSDEDLTKYAGDWTKVHERCASAVAFPRSTAEVSTLLRLCDEHDVWVVPSGGRTGLAGGAVASSGELVLSLEKMNRIHDVDPLSLTVHVEAGAVTQAVHDACRAHGLLWPIDLAAKGSSQIGGNIATNAGGVRVIRYGPTRQWVLGIVAVTMGGEVLRLNGALEKNNTGLDLRQLLIGSEGILAVVTEAVLKLTRLPPPSEVMLFALPDLPSVLRLAESARQGPFAIQALEMFSDACLVEVEARGRGRSPFPESSRAAPPPTRAEPDVGPPRPRSLPSPRRSRVYALLEVVSHAPDEVQLWLSHALESGLVEDGVLATSSAQVRALWALRENITESLSHRGVVHKNDIAVPVRELAPFVADLTSLLSSRHGELEVFLFGHIGDGNLHVNLPKPRSMEKEAFLARMREVDVDVAALLERHGGSVSAEHGIGLIKKSLLGYTRSAAEIELFRAIKRAFDPKGLLNPGKVFDLS